jgi:hypothetical protein
MNDELEKKLQQQLRASEDELDGPTLARLHAARNRALETAGGRRVSRWSGTWLTAAAAGVAAIALFINLRQPAEQEQIAAAELESALLAAAGSDAVTDPVSGEPVNIENNATETLDLLENLEFYEWLSETDVQEQQT